MAMVGGLVTVIGGVSETEFLSSIEVILNSNVLILLEIFFAKCIVCLGSGQLSS